MHILQLPVELHLEISDYVSQRDCAAMCSVNQELRAIYTKPLYSKDNQCALLWAADSGAKETVQLALDHGADINCTEEKKHHTALHVAALGGHLLVVKLILDNGVDVHAAWCVRDNVMELLLQYRTDVDKATRETPIYLSSSS
jgi:ankyrin repeat protein